MCVLHFHAYVCFVHIVFISIFSTSAATYSLRSSFSAAILVWALCYTFQIFIVKRDWINVCLCLVLPTLWHSRPTVLHCWYGKSMWLYNIIRLFARSFGRSFIREKKLSCLSAWILPFDHTVTTTKNTPIGKKPLCAIPDNIRKIYMNFVSSPSTPPHSNTKSSNYCEQWCITKFISKFYFIYSAAILWLLSSV